MLKLVLIEWNDAHASENSWFDVDTCLHCAQNITAGFLLKEEDDEIEVGLTVGNDKKLQSIVIPKGCIMRITEFGAVSPAGESEQKSESCLCTKHQD